MKKSGLLSFVQVCCILFIFDTQGEASSSYGAPASTHNGGAGSAGGESAPNYRFQYGVYDSKYGSDFGHEEERNGYETKGRYKVQLPDGRTQVVTYVADQNGYRADVTYEGSGTSSSSSGSGGPSSSYGAPAPPPPAPQDNHYNSGGGAGGGYSSGPSQQGAAASSQIGFTAPASSSRKRTFSTLKTTINGKTYGY